MHTVIETPAYIRAAKDAGMSPWEREQAVLLVAANPKAGAVIVGTGGCRKVRVAKEHGGKSGGYRVITFFGGENIPVFLISVFGKLDRANLTRAEQNDLARLAGSLRSSLRGTSNESR